MTAFPCESYYTQLNKYNERDVNERIAIKQHLSKPRPYISACGCLGPRDGDPDCPCAMQWYEKVDGNWYRINEERLENGIKLKATKV
jgi:hypothetical protein